MAGVRAGDDKAALETMARAAKTMRIESLDAAGAKIEAALARRLEAQPSEAANAATMAQSELARSLMHPDAPPIERVSGRDRQAVEAAAAARADAERIDRLIAQLAALDEDADMYVDRVLGISLEKDIATRAMQLDSLTIEVSERETSRRSARASSRLTGEALAELTPFDGPVVEALRERLREAIAASDAAQHAGAL